MVALLSSCRLTLEVKRSSPNRFTWKVYSWTCQQMYPQWQLSKHCAQRMCNVVERPEKCQKVDPEFVSLAVSSVYFQLNCDATDAKIAMNLRKWKAETVAQWSFLLIHTKTFVSFFNKQLLQSLFKQKCQTFSFWVERKHLVIFGGFAENLAPWG